MQTQYKRMQGIAISLLLATVCGAEIAEKPNFVIIMADDMGFDDISFRGSNQFLTPNIDALAYSGVILKNLYTPAMCTPSRAAVLTGKYPINTGMQHYVIANDQPWGLPLNETTMAEIFQQHGYYTSLIGKWHLGMSRKNYTPTMRGFDKHYGYLGSYIDYYDQTLFWPTKNFSRGHDFRDNFQTTRKHIGTYVTDTLTEETVHLIRTHNVTAKPLFLILSHLAPHSGNDDKPLQAPPEEIKKFSYITDRNRRTYAAMMSLLDKSVGLVIDALSEKGILNNTIILFYSDNGGPTVGEHSTTASNYPLRGQKNSPWEGGLRSSAAIWTASFEKLGTVWKQKIYLADFLPTLASAAGIHLEPKLELDGLNLWSALKYGYQSVEREIVHNIDPVLHYTSYSKGKWKFVNGTTVSGEYDGWLSERPANSAEVDPRSRDYEELIRNTTVWQSLQKFRTNSTQVNITQLRLDASVICQFSQAATGYLCKPLEGPCLFDTDIDPCEQNNLYDQYKNSKIMNDMLERIDHFGRNARTPNNKPSDPLCDPGLYKGEWTWWQDEQDDRNSAAGTVPYIRYIFGSIILISFLFTYI